MKLFAVVVWIIAVSGQQQSNETCNNLDRLIRNRNTMQAEQCSRNTLCTEVNCITVADVDQNERPTHIVNYIVTFDPCAMPFTVRYQNTIDLVGNPLVTEVDNTTNSNLTQTYGDNRRVDLVVIQDDNGNGITFGAIITTPEQTTPLQLFSNTEIKLQCPMPTTQATATASQTTAVTTTSSAAISLKTQYTSLFLASLLSYSCFMS